MLVSGQEFFWSRFLIVLSTGEIAATSNYQVDSRRRNFQAAGCRDIALQIQLDCQIGGRCAFFVGVSDQYDWKLLIVRAQPRDLAK
jgi:hypothetical protein